MQVREPLLMTPGPTNVPLKVMEAMLQSRIFHRGPSFWQLYKEIQEGLKYLFQTSGDVFVLTSSGSGSTECAISNVVSPGDKILTIVNGVFSQGMREIAELFGGKTIELSVPWDKPMWPQDVEDQLKRKKDIKAILMTYCETSTGITAPLAEIGEISAKYDKLLIVDAISILGGDHLKTDAWHVDLCTGASQKCLACPPGLGLISVSERVWEIIEERKRPISYFDLIKFREYDRRMETPHTPALPLFYALREALGIIREEGLENRIRRHRTCAKALREGLKAMGLKLFSKDEKFASNTVTAVKMPEHLEEKRVREIMRKRYGVIVAGSIGTLRDILRIGTMGVVTESDIMLTLSALEGALNESGFKVVTGSGLSAAKEVFSGSG